VETGDRRDIRLEETHAHDDQRQDEEHEAGGDISVESDTLDLDNLDIAASAPRIVLRKQVICSW
jgi:hypothetical protein